MSVGDADRGLVAGARATVDRHRSFLVVATLASVALAGLTWAGVLHPGIDAGLLTFGGLVGSPGRKKLPSKEMAKHYAKKKILGFVKKIILRYISGPLLVVILLLALVFSAASSSTAANACAAMGATTTATLNDLSPQQMNNAATIIATAESGGFGREGAIVGLITAAQESVFKNYASSRIPESLQIPHDDVGSDHYSVGVFQQQTGPFGDYWGTVSELMVPANATARFFEELVKKVPDRAQWATDPGGAAQTVQVSAFPDAYDKHIPLANQLIDTIQPNMTVTPGGAVAAAGCAAGGAVASPDGTLVKPINSYELTSGFGMRSGGMHEGIDLAGPIGEPIFAAMDGTVSKAGSSSGYGLAVFIEHANGIQTQYGHIDQVLTTVGAQVTAGDQIATRGNSGRSTGPHLHFEIVANGTAVDPVPFYAQKELSF